MLYQDNYCYFLQNQSAYCTCRIIVRHETSLPKYTPGMSTPDPECNCMYPRAIVITS